MKEPVTMKKALVTGGMGFIGGHLVNELLALGVKVIVLDSSIHKPVPFPHSAVEIVEANVQSREILKECLKQVDVCFHLAALSSLVVSNRDWLYSHQNNVVAFNILLDVLKDLQLPIKLIYASSAAVYGNINSSSLNETMTVRPASAYGADKFTNEIYANVVSQCYQIPSIGLRLFNVYGPGQLASNPYSGVITCFKKALAEKSPLVIYGTGEQTRDFIFVKDVVNAFIMAAKTDYELSGIFNICTGRETSINHLAEIIMDLLYASVPIVYKAQRVGDLLHSCGNKNLAFQELGFAAKTSMREGLSFLNNTNNS